MDHSALEPHQECIPLNMLIYKESLIFFNFFFFPYCCFLSSLGHPLVFGFHKNAEFRIFLSTFKVCKLSLENRLVPELPGRAAF